MLSDQQLMPGFKGAMALATPAANVGMEPKGHESSEDDWENIYICFYNGYAMN